MIPAWVGAIGSGVGLCSLLLSVVTLRYTRRDVARRFRLDEAENTRKAVTSALSEMASWRDDATSLRKRVVDVEDENEKCNERVRDLERRMGQYAVKIDDMERKLDGKAAP